MKVLHHGAWLLLTIILQTMIFNSLTVFGVNANLFIVVVIAVALLGGKIQGMICGMVFGLICDFMVGRLLGANMLAFALAGYASGIIGGRYYSTPPFYIFMAIGGAVTACTQIFYMIPYTAGLEISAPFWYVIKTIVIQSVMCGILVIPVLWCIKRTTKLFRIQNINFR